MENYPSYARQGTTLKWFRNLFILLISGFILWEIVPPMMGIIMLFMIALIISYLLEPAVSYFENKGLPRVISIITLFIIVGILMYVAGNFLVTPLRREITDLINSVESEKIYTVAGKVKDFITVNFPFISEAQIDQSLQELLTTFQSAALNLSRSSLLLLTSVFSLLTQIILVPLIIFFILKDGPTLKRQLTELIPNKYFEMSINLIHKTDKQIGSFIRGQIVDNMILAILYSIGYYYLDIPFFIVFGFFSGVANIIPYIGPVLGAIPPVIVVIMELGNFSLIPAILILFIVIQIIENSLIQPTVVAKSVDLHPLIIIFAVLTGGQLLGIVGMLFSVLLAGVVKVLITEISWSMKNYDTRKRSMRSEDRIITQKN